MINWQFFPKSRIIPNQLRAVVKVFEDNEEVISSESHNYGSNDVLEKICRNLETLNF